jgi:hypothetical protein
MYKFISYFMLIFLSSIAIITFWTVGHDATHAETASRAWLTLTALQIRLEETCWASQLVVRAKWTEVVGCAWSRRESASHVGVA